MTSKAAPDPEAWGIELRYRNSAKEWIDAPQSTVDAILQAMGADGPRPPTDEDRPVEVVTEGQAPSFDEGGWRLVLEDGTTLDGAGPLPPDLPLGYHELTTARRQSVRLIVAPGACVDLSD